MTMPGVFGKLQLKDQADIAILGAPASFEKALRALKGVRVHRQLNASAAGFALAFVTKQAELERYAAGVKRYAAGDSVIWVAYPKGSSKRYASELSRDTGWRVLGDLGFEPVRMIAIDEDWSALRFRRAQFIKTMKRGREYAISRAGKKKAAKGRRRR